MTERTALYRFYRTNGSPLYFGITNNTKVRFNQHRREKSWWADVDHARTRVEWFDSRDEAETAELAAIRTEQPVHNVVTSDENGCARFVPRPGGGSWGRSAWTPETATTRQLTLRAATVRAMRVCDALEADAYAIVGLAHAAGVPMEELAEHTHRSRATLFRRVPKTPNAALWMGDNFDEIRAIRPDARLTPDGDLEIERVDEPGTWVVVGRNYVVHRREVAE